MKIQYLLFIAFLNVSLLSFAQSNKGTVVTDTLYSKNLENDFGENPSRAVSVYLPPNYQNSDQHYPVIYFLHGFMGDNKMMDMMASLLDYAIADKKIKPFIMVIPDEKTTYQGSFYSNSGVFGNWEDFTAFDLVKYMDENYRTIPKKESRGITGHSMGGYGALKMAMHHPDIFSTVYAISPGALTIVAEYGPNSNTFRELSAIKTIEGLKKSYFGAVMMAFGRAWSPNPDKPPFYCDFPFVYNDDKLTVNQEVLQKWYDNMPVHMIDENLENLQQLKAIKLDWGRNAGDRFTLQCDMFSQRLENVGITHFAEEYIGTHGSGIYTKEGRIPQQVLPFFDFYLEFSE
ncbi:Putative esterase [Draconibacterium orientale]|uniref:Esterase n=1 Tax=Draconibacterium orientale TaxID=1168034 RepID=X5DC77_9BACT|nr:alpha/beta fold hydrolase [Draconibacterium orientale]AHW58564.1 esterase [Draconibacterium orientale]SEU13231.1 Putative esterase [Draconibacterium orientale]